MPITARTGPSRRARDSESQIARPSRRGCGGVQPVGARRPVGGRGEAGAGIAIPICRAASAGRLSEFFCDMHRARPKSRGNPLEAPHACLRHRPRRPATPAGSKASIASFRYRPSSAAPRGPPARRSSSAVAAAPPSASDGTTPARRRRAPGSPAVAARAPRAARRAPRPTAPAPSCRRTRGASTRCEPGRQGGPRPGPARAVASRWCLPACGGPGGRAPR